MADHDQSPSSSNHGNCANNAEAQTSTGRVRKFIDSVSVSRFFAPKQETDMWACSRCTLHNRSSDGVCAACQNGRADPPKSCARGEAAKFLPVRQTSESMDLVRQVEECDAVEMFDHITAYCKVNKQSFVDDSFPPNQKSIGRINWQDQNQSINFSAAQNLEIQWRRPYDLAVRQDELDPRTFRPLAWTVYSKPRSTDIVQGFLGNCWFLSAMAVLAERKDLLEHVVVTKYVNAEGVYQIRLCVDGRWRLILVDDLLPCDAFSRMIFSHAKRRQLWVPLIEKALAKLHGSYAALSTGRTLEGLAVLTGAPCVTVSLEHDESLPDLPADLDLVWAKLLSAKEAGFIMGCSCGAGSRPVDEEQFCKRGLQPRHAYSLLDAAQSGAEDTRRVLLRNPWARGSYKAEADSSQNDFAASDGLFWMPFGEFCKYFDSVDICKLRTGCKEIRLELPLPADCTPKNVYCAYFTVHDETAEVDLVLHQVGIRNEIQTSHGMLDLCIMVFHTDIYGRVGSMVACTDRIMRPFVVADSLFLARGTYAVLSMSLVHWQTELPDPPKGILAAHSTKKVEVQLSQAVPSLLADALIQYMLRHGEPCSEFENVTIFYVSKRWSGIAIMVENATYDCYILAKCDCSTSENVVSTRGCLLTNDVIPPRHRQVTIVLTQLEPTSRYMVAHSVSLARCQTPYLGATGNPVASTFLSHWPALDEKVRGLHEPRPL